MRKIKFFIDTPPSLTVEAAFFGVHISVADDSLNIEQLLP